MVMMMMMMITVAKLPINSFDKTKSFPLPTDTAAQYL